MVCGSYGDGTSGLSTPFVSGRRRGLVDGIDVLELNLAYANRDSLARRSAIFLCFAIHSTAVALSEPCDIMFATSTPLTASVPGIIGRWVRRKPFVFEVRDLWPELPRAMGVVTNPVVVQLLSGLEWVAYRSAVRLIGLSPGIVEGVVRRRISRERIAMVPNGCDLSLFQNPVSRWRPAGASPADLLAVYTGSHGVANGLDSVLDAARELKARGRTDIRVLLIGQGKLKPALQDRVAREGLDNVLFHSPVDKPTLAGLLAAADLGLQILADVPAFYYGTSPNKFFDYLSAGLPVLTNYPGWLTDMIKESDCGFAVPPANPAAFADALEQAADDRHGLKGKGEHALALGRQRFNRTDLGVQFVDWVVGAAG
jgi:glycosyltransferase involved in cell wall biosynthesis